MTMTQADKRRKPDLPYQASPKTQVGRDQQAFKQKRTDANAKGWKTRREKGVADGQR
jgi:hypothetical protein